MLDPGDEAPDFELPNLNHEPVRLSDNEGRVVLHFCPREDTPWCTTEVCGCRDDWDAYEGVDPEDRAEAVLAELDA